MSKQPTVEPEYPPAPDRVDPPYVADERTMLTAWLDFHRATLWLKCEGLSHDQLRLRSVEPSTLSLLGLVRHLADVERSWFRRRFAGEDVPPLYYSDAEPDGEFDRVEEADAAADIATWRSEVAACREVASRASSLDDIAVAARKGQQLSLRWIYVHLIEEYARHNGHADLLRERIDGRTGE
jgi:uncharacterized damage-inducible protein DinB